MYRCCLPATGRARVLVTREKAVWLSSLLWPCWRAIRFLGKWESSPTVCTRMPSPGRNCLCWRPSPSWPSASFSCEEVWILGSFLPVRRLGHSSVCLSGGTEGGESLTNPTASGSWIVWKVKLITNAPIARTPAVLLTYFIRALSQGTLPGCGHCSSCAHCCYSALWL